MSTTTFSAPAPPSASTRTLNATKLASLIRKPPAPVEAEPPAAVAAREPVATLVHAFLLWEAGTEQACEAYRRIERAMVDLNELRVSLPDEIVGLLGERYPRAQERALRLRASLNDLFRREHALAFPAAGGKKDLRAYVESLEGIVVPSVAAHVLLTCFGVHAVPVDERIRAVLAAAGVCDPDTPVADLSAFLVRQVKAEQAPAVAEALRAIADASAPVAPRRGRATTRQGAKSGGESGAGGPTTSRTRKARSG